VNQKRGVRWNTSKGFLHSITAARPNLTVQTHAHVTRMLFDETKQRALGVEYFVRGREGQLERVLAGLETVLSAGAIGTPQLLQLSGVGPGRLLRDEKAVADVVLDAPGVGANLQDHTQIRTAYRVEGTRTLNDWYASLWGRVEMASEYLMKRSGPLSMAPSQLGVFAKSDPTQPRANLEYHVQPLSLDRFGEPLHNFPAFTAAIVPLQPTSTGRVAIRDLDPRTPPVIQPNYFDTEADRRVAADAIRLTRRLALESRALARFNPQEHSPGLSAYPADASDAALADAAARIATTIFHPACTCKMGADDDAMAVLDPFLRVRGLEGLSVADASAMPRITSGNTNSPTIMVAEKAADFLHARHGTGRRV
jgi:choline dehydrogenase